MMKWEAGHGFPFLRFQKTVEFINGSSADVAAAHGSFGTMWISIRTGAPVAGG